MKFFIALILLLPLSALARQQTMFTAGLEALSTGNVSPEITCQQALENGDPLPLHCRDLSSAICSLPKGPDGAAIKDREIARATYDPLPANATQAQRNRAAQDAIGMSDTQAYDNNSADGPSRDDVRRMMDPARWNVISLFNGVGYPSVDKQRQMANTVQNIRLKTGTEYVASLVQWGRQQNPSASQETLRRDAITTYTAACGRTGMEANAFFEEGEVILCPGLAYSMRDYGNNNKIEEIKAALIFTMSHEITHSIDYLVNPTNFDKLISCYQRAAPDASIFGNRNKLAELTSDYFGAFALGKYLADNALKLGLPPAATPASASTVLRILARSVGSYCTVDPTDTDHPNPSYRMNQVLARAPGIKAALGCPAPTADNPSCTLRGENPPRPGQAR
ncbi:MAG: hypothetical protein V4598_17650 [Bdellovibrionota bacterium]